MRSPGFYGGGAALSSQIWPGIPAHTASPLEFVGSTAMNAINDMMFCRVLAGFTLGATAIRINITNTSGNLCVAVYADDGTGLPGARLATSGSVASPGNGVRSIALGSAVDITPGMWMALGADNTTITFARGGIPAGAATMGVKFQAKQTTAFPAPATAAATADWRVQYIMIAE